MREVLWVIGAREEAGLDLAVQLRHAAARMLAGRTLHWEVLDLPPATAWSAEERRHVFLFFKETLANIVRHASAKAVRLSAVCREGEFTLVITDDGRGFDLARIVRGLGLTSMRDRARLIGGRCEFVTAPGAGTRVTLRVPVHRQPIRHPAGTTALPPHTHDLDHRG